MAIYKDLNDYEVMYLVEENNENANELLFDKYRPIVLKIASQFKKEAKKYGLDMDDLVQEGYIGLYNAIQTYDSNKNALFYTYAIISIRSRIINCLTSKNAIKYQVVNHSISLFNQISYDEDTLLIDVLEDKNAVLPNSILEENEMADIVHNFLLSLNFSHSLIFELKMNGFKNKDIVELLDLPLKYVSNSLFRIRAKFQKYFQSYF